MMDGSEHTVGRDTHESDKRIVGAEGVGTPEREKLQTNGAQPGDGPVGIESKRRQTNAVGEGGTPRKLEVQTGQKVWKTAKGFPSTIPRLRRGARRGNRNAFKHGHYSAERNAVRRLINQVIYDAELTIAWLEQTRRDRASQ